jgi:hypothetical protein
LQLEAADNLLGHGAISFVTATEVAV